MCDQTMHPDEEAIFNLGSAFGYRLGYADGLSAQNSKISEDYQPEDILVTELGIDKRITNPLESQGIHRVSHIYAFDDPWRELGDIRTIGPNTLQVLRTALLDSGYPDIKPPYIA